MRHARGGAALALLLALAAGSADAAQKDLFLGSADIRCADTLRIHGRRKLHYPPGKNETMRTQVPSEVVLYECGYQRARLVCANHTSRIEVRRVTGTKTFAVKCYGKPPLRGGEGILIDGAADATDPESGAEGADADGSSPSGSAAPP